MTDVGLIGAKESLFSAIVFCLKIPKEKIGQFPRLWNFVVASLRLMESSS